MTNFGQMAARAEVMEWMRDAKRELSIGFAEFSRPADIADGADDLLRALLAADEAPP